MECPWAPAIACMPCMRRLAGGFVGAGKVRQAGCKWPADAALGRTSKQGSLPTMHPPSWTAASWVAAGACLLLPWLAAAAASPRCRAVGLCGSAAQAHASIQNTRCRHACRTHAPAQPHAHPLTLAPTWHPPPRQGLARWPACCHRPAPRSSPRPSPGHHYWR